MLAPLSLPIRSESIGIEIVYVVVAFDHHITATAAITSVRTAKWYEFLTPKTHASASTVAGPGGNHHFIDEHTQRCVFRSSSPVREKTNISPVSPRENRRQCVSGTR